MKPSRVWKSAAVVSAAALLLTACGDDGDSPDDDNGSDVDGIPASEMRSWDVDCDWYLLDDLQDFLGFEEWWTGPMAADHGGGSNPSALTCEASFFWPEFESPLGDMIQRDATFGYDVYPQDSQEDAKDLFEHRIDHMQGFHPEEELTISGEVDGNWIDSYYFLDDEGTFDSYFMIIQDEDFVMDFQINIPGDPTDSYEEHELVPGEWAGYEFDQESATEFFFEEQMPNIHQQFLTLLEREG